MPYVGNPLADAYSARQKQDLTGQSGTSFTLTHSVSSPNDLSVYINHVRQEPTTAYTVNGTALETTGTVAGTDDFYIIYDELAIQSISHPTNQALTATAGTFTSGLVGTTATFSGALSATTGTFSGAVDIQGQELILDADNDTSITADTDDEIHFKVAGSDHVKIKGGTNVLHVIEGSSGQGTPHTNSGVVIESDGQTGINILSGNTDFAGLVFGDDGDADIGFIQYKHDDNYLRFGTNTSEKMRIASDGKVGIGLTAPLAKLDVNGTTDAELRVTRQFATVSSAYSDQGSVLHLFNDINFENGYDGNSHVGQILFTSDDDSTGQGIRAKIACVKHGYGHTESLGFYVSPSNTATNQCSATNNGLGKRMSIPYNGRIQIGSVGDNMAGASLVIGNSFEEGYSVSSSSSTQLKKGGKTFMTKDASTHNTDTNIFWSPRSTGWSMFYWNKVNDGGSDNRYVDLYFDGSSKGTIKYNTSSGGIDYNTSSDYRLKDNIKDKDIDSLYDDVKKLKVRTFKYKKDVDESADDTVGFIAHEVQEVFSQLCETPKDAMKDNIEGRTPEKLPDYQQLDYGKFTPFIIGALQKAMEKIETLEAKVKALEEA